MLDGRYEYKKLLGKGGSGSVYLCFDHKLQKYWAVKEFQGKLNEERNRELDLLKKISCNRFPRIVDAVFEEDSCCLVMDLIEGENLKNVLKKGPLKEKQVVDIALQISEGLDYLHKCNPPMVYMDCKPENIMLDSEGKVKLIDFGSVFIAKEGHSNLGKQRISGSRFYAPFEQMKAREEEIDFTTDVYALGMTLFVLLLGKELMVSKQKSLSVREYNKGISRGMDQIIKKCTEADRRKRFQNMEEFRNAILKKTEIGRVEQIRLCFFNVFKTLVKSFLCISFLFFLWYTKEFHHWETAILSFVLLLILMLQFPVKKKSLWEKKKSVSCVTVKKLFMNIFLVFNCFAAVFMSGCGRLNSKHEKNLEVTLYDHEFRKILIKNGSYWNIEEDILLSVPKEEICKNKGYIEVVYVSENHAKKKYRFQVERKKLQ